MSADSQMIVKGEEAGVFNLSVGEPYFLQDAFTEFFSEYLHYYPHNKLCYPSYGGNKELLDELKIIHSEKHIVVTNGGKQALLAAMYAYQTVRNFKSVYHKPPYWPSYPTLAKLCNLNFDSVLTHAADQLIVNTTPNNPDGHAYTDDCHIWDAAYAHMIYGSFSPPKHEIAIYTASKVLGLSGFRVGWLVTDNDELAQAARHYLEITTSGVSSPAQELTARTLHLLRSSHIITCDMYHKAKAILSTNCCFFKQFIAPHCSEIHGAPNGHGMFGWFKVKDSDKFSSALQKSHVKLVTGDVCGMTEDGWYRMNLGHRNSVTEEALTSFAKSYI